MRIYIFVTVASFVGMGEEVTKEAFDWIKTHPKFLMDSSLISRLINDIRSNEVKSMCIFIMSNDPLTWGPTNMWRIGWGDGKTFMAPMMSIKFLACLIILTHWFIWSNWIGANPWELVTFGDQVNPLSHSWSPRALYHMYKTWVSPMLEIFKNSKEPFRPYF